MFYLRVRRFGPCTASHLEDPLPTFCLLVTS